MYNKIWGFIALDSDRRVLCDPYGDVLLFKTTYAAKSVEGCVTIKKVVTAKADNPRGLKKKQTS